MSQCFEHPTLPEFTCCGRAWDDDESEEGRPEIALHIKHVDCTECLRTIRAFKAIRLPKLYKVPDYV